MYHQRETGQSRSRKEFLANSNFPLIEIRNFTMPLRFMKSPIKVTSLIIKIEQKVIVFFTTTLVILFPFFSYLLIKEEKRTREWITKVVVKNQCLSARLIIKPLLSRNYCNKKLWYSSNSRELFKLEMSDVCELF